MILRIDGKIVDVLENVIFPNTAEKMDKIIVPDLTEEATSILDALDKFNYDLLSRTETTEYLYRFSRHSSEFYLGGEFIESFKGSLIDVGVTLDQIFLWWL